MRPELREILVCPMCKGPLTDVEIPWPESVRCQACSVTFRCVDGIPDIMPVDTEVNHPADYEGWSSWSAKLENFVLWRKRTWDGSARAEKLDETISDIKASFIAFTGLKGSSKRILDIGCGDGGIRRLLGNCYYCGIDPLLIESNVYDFPVVRGVGEHLPFRTGSFSEVILNQVLDHCNSVEQTLEEIVRVTGDGPVNVMQFVFRPEELSARIYQRLLRLYLSIKGIKDLDTKMRRFDMESLIHFFEERFAEVTFLKYSDSQVFIKAIGWKKNRK